MKNKYFILLTLTILISVLSFGLVGCLPIKSPNPNKKIDTSNMTLVLEENFDDNHLNENLWTGHSENRRGGYWDIDQVSEKDGLLTITTEYKENGKFGAGWYTGSIFTKNKFYMKKGGYTEVRCIMPKGQGHWGAYWLSSDGMTDSTLAGSEIDVVESPYYDDPYNDAKIKNTAFHTLHIKGYGNEHKSKQSPYYKVDKDMYNEFNTYGVYWDDDEYIFYVNGMETWRTTFGVHNVPEYLWLSVEIAGEMGSANPSNPENKFTWSGEIENNPQGKNFKSEFIIDYVKCWE